LHRKTKEIIKIDWSEENFSPKHSANESFVGTTKDSNPMTNTFVGKKNLMDPNYYTITSNQTSPKNALLPSR
jgi:hypothetical protein